jgi:RNA polymerase sigma factor (sigma-70 family)
MNWLTELKSNPDKTLAQIYDLHAKEGVMWAMKQYGLDTESACELVQTAIVILYDNVVSGKLTDISSNIKTYLFSIIKHKIIQEFRRSNKFTIIDANMAIEDHVSESEDVFVENLQKARESLLKLGDPCKTMLELFYFEGKSIEEVTQILDYKNSDTTKNLKYKCIKRLQKVFFE